MVKRREPDPKEETLKKHGALNPQAEEVRDPLFQEDPFFDPRDLVQVKYEMLRQVRLEGKAVTDSASSFGFSRPSFYESRAAFEEGGLSGLLPKKRGPHGGHKLTEEVIEFLKGERERDEAISGKTLADLLRERYGLKVHPRTIDRALKRRKKKPL
jgi:transposase